MQNGRDVSVLHNAISIPCTRKPTFYRVKVTDISDVDTWVARMAEWSVNGGGKWVFRGHSHSFYQISSSFDRLVFPDKDENKSFWRFSVGLFKDLHFEFEQRLMEIERHLIDDFERTTKTWQMPESKSKRRLEMIAQMQHYGVPTRLIDFTRNPDVALYLAVRKAYEQDYSVWAVNMEKCCNGLNATENNLEVAERFFSDSFEDLFETMHGSPGLLEINLPNPNRRMAAQSGLFLMPTSLAIPAVAIFYSDVAEVSLGHLLMDEKGEYVARPIPWKEAVQNLDSLGGLRAIQFIFDKRTRTVARSGLEQKGVNALKLFPDAPLDAEAQFLKSDYGARLATAGVAESLRRLVWWI